MSPKHECSALIIEDDEIAAEILQKFVQYNRPHIKVDWCWNGYEALVRVQEMKPDIIFLDYMMPKLDGMEFLAAVNELETRGKCKIAVISAYVDKNKEELFFQQGADYVLPKPIKFEQIDELMEKIEAGLTGE